MNHGVYIALILIIFSCSTTDPSLNHQVDLDGEGRHYSEVMANTGSESETLSPNSDSIGGSDNYVQASQLESDIVVDTTPYDAPGYLELLAYMEAYPTRISDLEYVDNDWSVMIDNIRFFWAHGRLLMEDKRDQWEDYYSYNFSEYIPGPLQPLNITQEMVETIEKQLAYEEENPFNRSPDFYNELLMSWGAASSYEAMERISFLGMRVTIHNFIVPVLRKIETEILELAKVDPAIDDFLETIHTVTGYNYRTIAGTVTRSFHSYGIAVDFQPYYYDNKQVYWQWAMDWNSEWYKIPYSARWMPPESIISIFERNGFVWAGKWVFFDTIHFEYRPELYLLMQYREDEDLIIMEGQ